MVTIIIPAKSPQDRFLGECIESVKRQTYKNLCISYAFGGDLASARKKAIMETDTKYIMLLDSDQIMESQAIEKCVEECEKGAEGITLWEKSLHPVTWLEKVIAFDKELFHSAHDDDPIKGAAEPRFFRSSYLKQLDFQKLPPLTFELTLINKQVRDMGARIKFLNYHLWHHEPNSIFILFKKFFRYGYFYYPSIKMYPQVVIGHSKPRRVYFTLKAIKHPLLYIGLWLHYFVKGIATVCGILWYMINVGISGYRRRLCRGNI